MINFKKITCFILSLVLILICFSSLAFGEDMTVKVSFISDDGPISLCNMQLYKVADVNGRLVGDFAVYPVKFDPKDADTMAMAAKTLTNYIRRDSVKPLLLGKTDENGGLSFSVAEKGIYLLVGEKTNVNGTVYVPESVMFSMPSLDEKGNEVYNLELYPKYEKEPTNETVTRKVLKSWENDNPKKRPESITVELLCDGKSYAKAVLNEENSWRYEWKNLDSSKTWSLTETNVPQGYSVSISLEGITYHVVNSFNTTPPPQEPTTGDKQEIIPETGVLWWPVPYITCLGLLLIIIGYVKKYKEA